MVWYGMVWSPTWPDPTTSTTSPADTDSASEYGMVEDLEDRNDLDDLDDVKLRIRLAVWYILFRKNLT